MSSLPTVSLSGLSSTIVHSQPQNPTVLLAAKQVTKICETTGFFYISDFSHLLPESVFQSLDSSARTFFNLPEETKMKIDMNQGGAAWRGFFPVGNELTSGVPDLKEGIYFGTELPALNKKRVPLHGVNQFPDEEVPEMRTAVLNYMRGCQEIGHTLMGLISIGLELPSPDFISSQLTKDPLELFRIFHYPPRAKTIGNKKFDKSINGVSEHCDYGVITLLRANDLSGLQVQDLNDPKRFIDVKHVEGAMVVNIGDMLEGLTHGLLKSTLHRVKQPQDPNSMRISFPYFFDPNFNATVKPLPLNDDILRRAREACERRENAGFKRWDASGSTLKLAESGRDIKYGDYVLSKVAKCFPSLFKDVVVAKL